VRASQPQVHAVEFQAAQPFVPPRGFQPVSLNDNATSTATNIFNNLQGKQVWHITAPAGVPLKDLKELAMAKVLDGDAVLSYKGADYGFSKTELNEDGTREVLVPQKNGYKAGSSTVDIFTASLLTRVQSLQAYHKHYTSKKSCAYPN
jgi:hypothetical protein